jgi:hypothetical protein
MPNFVDGPIFAVLNVQSVRVVVLRKHGIILEHATLGWKIFLRKCLYSSIGSAASFVPVKRSTNGFIGNVANLLSHQLVLPLLRLVSAGRLQAWNYEWHVGGCRLVESSCIEKQKCLQQV